MATNKVDLYSTRGDTLEFIGTLTPGVGQSFALPVASLKFSAKRKFQDTSVIFEIDTTSGIVIVGQSTTQISYKGIVPAAATALVDLKVKKLLYDLQLTEADGKVSTPVGGRIHLDPDVTPP